MSERITLEKIVEISTRRGIVYPTASIYGGLSGFFDWGPVGSEIRKNVLDSWWNFFVRSREDVVGIHGSIITHPRVWEASGHTEEFIDILVECKKCKARFRADQLLEELGIKLRDETIEAVKEAIEKNNVHCPKCGGELGEPRPFNLMFETYVGPQKEKGSLAYLRPETAQLIFIHFKEIMLSARMKIPFGIAQIGRAFRNEISPRNFIFRMREFEQMELEFFVDPEKINACPYFKNIEDLELPLLPAEVQENNEEKILKIKTKEAVESGYIQSYWHAYWTAESYRWLLEIGIKPENLRVREHLKTELAHYAIQTFDIEYNFPFMGWKEIVGIANRGDYDLRRHAQFSGSELRVIEEGRRYYPYVIEPSFGLERTVLALLTDGYKIVDGKNILSLKPEIAPFKVGVYPLLKREEFVSKAHEIYKKIQKVVPQTFFDASGSIGKRYARADEIGVPLGITIDHQTLEDDTVTIRFRDTKEQIRVHNSELIQKILEYISS
ncbi:MAG: glycine--tRNA ligase [Candidatus Njordarchaeia archaeon]